MGFCRFQNEHYFNKKCIIDMDIINDVRCMRQSVITHVVVRISSHEVIR